MTLETRPGSAVSHLAANRKKVTVVNLDEVVACARLSATKENRRHPVLLKVKMANRSESSS